MKKRRKEEELVPNTQPNLNINSQGGHAAAAAAAGLTWASKKSFPNSLISAAFTS